MIRKEDVKKMLVSDDGEDWLERLVVQEFSDGSCVAVSEGYEEAFFSNDANCGVLYWILCKPIP